MAEAFAAMNTAIAVVQQQQSLLSSQTSNWISTLRGALADLGKIDVGVVPPPSRPSEPSIPNLAVNMGASPQYTARSISLPRAPVEPVIDAMLAGLDSVVTDDAPEAPVMPQLTIPEAPAMTLPAKPTRPSIDMAVPIPAAPVVDLPQIGALKDIPDFSFPLLADFDGTPPSLDLAVPNVFINWTEPAYESEVLDELVAWVKQYMQGGTGLPAHVQDALFSRSRDRVSAETHRAVQEAVSTWAGRGFSMPPGMLAKQVNVAREEGRTKAGELNRDILIEATKWEIENIRFAVQQGIAIEQLISNIHENAAKRMFEVARFQAEAQITLFNAQVGLFNAKLAGFNALREAFRMRLDRALATLEVWKTRAQAAQAHNANEVEVFKAKYIAVQQAVETFKALMDGAKVKAEVIDSQLQAYRADVQAFAEQVGAEKVKFDAYDARVRGESAKAGLFEAQSRAYASTIQAIANKADIAVKGKQLMMEGARVKIAAYQANVDGWRAEVDAELRESLNGIQAFQAKVEAWRAEASVNVSHAEVLQRFADVQTRTNIAYSEMQISEYNAKMQHAIATAQIAVEAAKAVGQYSAQMAAGAMSAINVSAGVSGTGSQSGNSSDSINTNHNYNY